MQSSRIKEDIILSLTAMRPVIEQETALVLSLVEDYDPVKNRELEAWIDEVEEVILYLREALHDLYRLERM